MGEGGTISATRSDGRGNVEVGSNISRDVVVISSVVNVSRIYGVADLSHDAVCGGASGRRVPFCGSALGGESFLHFEHSRVLG